TRFAKAAFHLNLVSLPGDLQRLFDDLKALRKTLKDDPPGDLVSLMLDQLEQIDEQQDQLSSDIARALLSYTTADQDLVDIAAALSEVPPETVLAGALRDQVKTGLEDAAAN